MNRNQAGFTIVELLIVIVVIAILAAISIVAYNGIQDRARSSAAASSSTQAAKKIKVWQVDYEGSSPSCAQFYALVTNQTGSACSFDYNDTNYQYTAGSSGAYCITTTVGNKSYKVSNSTTPTSGGCAGHGQGGVAAVTNLAINPSFESNLSGVSSYLVANTQPSGGAYSGNRFLRSTRTSATGTWGPWWDASANNVVMPGKRYHASIMMKSNVPIAHALRVEWLNSANDAIVATDTIATVSPGTSWTNIKGSAVAPANAARIRLTLYAVSDGSTTDYIDVDGVMITENNGENFADGNTTDWAWNGAVNNSTSTGPPV